LCWETDQGTYCLAGFVGKPVISGNMLAFALESCYE
jgi:hypothetical protein